MKLMEHVRELQAEVERRKNASVAQFAPVFEALDTVERFLQGQPEPLEQFAKDVVVMPPVRSRLDALRDSPIERPRVVVKGAVSASSPQPSPPTREVREKEGPKPKLIDVVREYAGRHPEFTGREVTEFIRGHHAHLKAANVSAMVCTLAGSGELGSRGAGRNRVFWKAEKKAAAKKTEPVATKPVPTPPAMRAVKTTEHVEGLGKATMWETLPAKAEPVPKPIFGATKPKAEHEAMDLVRAILEVVQPGQDNFTVRELDGRLMTRYQQIYFHHTSRDKNIIGKIVTMLVETGDFVVTNPHRAEGEMALYNRK